jgi:hypothetical protein
MNAREGEERGRAIGNGVTLVLSHKYHVMDRVSITLFQVDE